MGRTFFGFTVEQGTEKQESSWQGTLRTSFVKNLDKMLSVIFDEASRTYAVLQTAKAQPFENTHPELQRFNAECNYFSEEHPIVGKVTEEESDIALTQEALNEIHEKVEDPFQREIMTAEVVTKVLAYRELKEGQIIAIPTLDANSKPKLTSYLVDAVLDLWHGMPAFGLLPYQGEEGIPILLFRGTDFSLVTERGWASVISDLEIYDPGLRAFEQGREKIHEWLEKAEAVCCKARIMGFSLGGILTAYTVLYEDKLVNQEKTSFSFNAPGVSRDILREWEERRALPTLTSFVSQGDVIPKYGRLLKNTLLFSQEEFPAPLAGHTNLVTFSNFFYLQPIDILRENTTRKF
ncbi:MAG: DUF2974 domain-containing protein [Chlamydiales bacterium]|nr:DUF2974 domain-containing protein [Chlamydiales bacterium]